MISKKLIIAFFLLAAMPTMAQDADLTLIPYRQGDLWGFASPDKTIVISPDFEETDFFYEGYASVKKAGKYGYINKGGRLVIPARYYSVTPFRFGFFPEKGAKNAIGEVTDQRAVLFAGATVKTNGAEICIDNKGVTLPKCPAIAVGNTEEINKANTVTVKSNYSTIRKSDLFDKIEDDYKMPGAEDSYYIAIRGDKYGVFNKTFDVIVPFEYTKIEKINMGVMPYLIVEKDGLKGMTFGNGSLYMPVENTSLKTVSAAGGNNFIIFTKDGKTGLKSSKYKIIAEPVYADIVYDERGGFILTGDNKLKGFCFVNNNIIQPKYENIKVMNGGEYILVTEPAVKSKLGEEKTVTAGKKGYINNNLVEFFTN